MVLLVALAGALSAILLLSPPAPAAAPSAPRVVEPPSAEADGLLRRARWLWAVLAGGGAAAFVGGVLALPAGAVVGVVVGVAAGRLEPGLRRACHHRRTSGPCRGASCDRQSSGSR